MNSKRKRSQENDTEGQATSNVAQRDTSKLLEILRKTNPNYVPPKVDEQLCSLCQLMFFHECCEDLSFKTKNGYKLDRLRESVQHGCKVCSLLLAIVEKERKANPRVQLTGEVEWTWRYYGELGDHASIFWRLNGSSLPLDQVELRIDGCYRDERYVLPQGNTGSEATFKQIESWIESCSNHPKCNKWLTACGVANTLPKRLVDVGSPNNATEARIVESGEISTRRTRSTEISWGRHTPDGVAFYNTLSHCWGGQLPTKLLTSNLSEFKSALPWSVLPKTFQEAIIATRKLDVRYLWIDALCIIQDSEEDWLQQAPLMGEIFAGSYVNISAAAAHDSTGSLFKERDPRVLSAAEVRIDYALWACFPIECTIDEMWSKIGLATVNTRGWVLQERLLSPRTVFFAKNQVAWECIQETSLEFDYDSSAALWEQSREPWHKKNLLDPDPFSHNYGSRESTVGEREKHLRGAWRDLVYNYTGSTLTFHSDRPYAVLGIAKVFGRHLGLPESDYIHGLWRPYLTQELMWTSENNQLARCSQVPTWSWLSSSGPVELPDFEQMQSTIELLDSAVNGAINQSPGEGPIRLSGPLCPVSFSRVIYHQGRRYWSGSISLGESRLDADPRFDCLYLSLDHSSEWFIVNLEHRRAYLLLGSVIKEPSWIKSANDQGFAHYGKGYTFLVIQPDNVEQGRYRRMGHLGISSRDEWSDVHKMFDQHLRSDNIPENAYENRDEDFNYTITLI